MTGPRQVLRCVVTTMIASIAFDGSSAYGLQHSDDSLPPAQTRSGDAEDGPQVGNSHPACFESRTLLNVSAIFDPATDTRAQTLLRAADEMDRPGRVVYQESGKLDRWWAGSIATDEGTTPVRVKMDIERGEARVFLPERGFYDLPLRVSGSQDSGLELRGEPFGPMEIALKRSNGALVGSYSGVGSQAGRITLESISAPLPGVREENVVFAGSGIELEGTLLLPPGPGPHPLIVWVHGSGNAGLRTNAIYRSHAWFLANQGVAALLYDKRGYGANKGLIDWDFYQLAQDARGALRFLLEREDIDPERIGIGGISQAGWVAPLAASEDEGFHFIVALSASGTTAADQNVFSLGGLLDQAGVEPAHRDAICGALRMSNEFYRTGLNREAVESELTRIRGTDWFRDFGYLPRPPLGRKGDVELATMFLDPAELWQRIEIPVLAIWGVEDKIIPAEQSMGVLRDAIRAEVLEHSHLCILDGADHILVDKQGQGPGGWPRIHPELEPLLSSWTRRLLQLD